MILNNVRKIKETDCFENILTYDYRIDIDNGNSIFYNNVKIFGKGTFFCNSKLDYEEDNEKLIFFIIKILVIRRINFVIEDKVLLFENGTIIYFKER